MKKRIVKYYKNALFKKKRNFIEQSLVCAFSFYKKLKKTIINSDNRFISKIYLKGRNIEQKIQGRTHNFITFEDAVMWIDDWIKSFPINYDIVIGIPRSGLWIANIIALKLGKPLTTPDLFNKDKIWKSKLISDKKYKNILLVDDSIDSGKTMEENLRILYSCNKKINITKAALIVTKDSKNLVDLYSKVRPQPRLFEWNIMHSKKGKLVSDLDGVICENCPPGIDLNEKKYTNWIKTAKPLFIPSFEIDVILSSRLMKYHSITKKWLIKQGVRYKKLILWDLKSKNERNGKHAQYKIEKILKIKPDIIWESSLHETKQIWKVTKIPTLCFDEKILFGNGNKKYK